MQNPKPSWTTLADDLELVTTCHAEAVKEEDIARSRVTAALNRLNAAQKAFDKAVTEVRAAAPRESDWKREPGLPA